MHWIDFSIFAVYLIFMLGVGFFFLKKNKNTEDYFVGGRQMSSLHIGLSVVATDVGGGFSIGLGGLGFVMGVSGSWLLFSGLIGAWLTAVVMVPKVHRVSKKLNLLSFPQFLEHSYNKRVALIAELFQPLVTWVLPAHRFWQEPNWHQLLFQLFRLPTRYWSWESLPLAIRLWEGLKQ